MCIQLARLVACARDGHVSGERNPHSLLVQFLLDISVIQLSLCCAVAVEFVDFFVDDVGEPHFLVNSIIQQMKKDGQWFNTSIS